MTVSLTVYEIFSVKIYRDLENWVRGSSVSLKMAPFDIMTLKSWLEVTQDHSNRYHSKAWVQFPIRLP